MNKRLIAGAAALIIAFSAVQIQPVLSGDAGTHSIQITAEASKKSNSKKTNKSSSLASKAVKVKEKDLEYKYDTVNKGIKITKYNGSAKSIILPSEIGGNKVVGVEISNDNLKYVKVPEGVSFVSFQFSSKLEEVSLPESLTTLENMAFTHTSLKKIKLPKKVMAISCSCFSGCEDLTEIDMPGVKYIMSVAFNGCHSLKKIDLSNIKCIGFEAFYECNSLTRVTIPYIERGYEGDSLGYIGQVDEHGKYVLGIDEQIFEECKGLKKVISYSSIKNDQFVGCSALEEVTLITDSNFKEDRFIIGGGAFIRCSSLKKVDLSKVKKPITIEGLAFGGCSSLRSLSLPDNTIVVKDAFYNCNALTVTYKGKKYNYSNFDKLYELFK